jgi:hypothetical protein
LKQAHFEILPGFWGYLEYLEKAYYLENLSLFGVPTFEYLEKLGGFRVSLSILRRASVEKLPRFGVLVTSIGTLQYTTCP